jgi:hypothetical protein
LSDWGTGRRNEYLSGRLPQNHIIQLFASPSNGLIYEIEHVQLGRLEVRVASKIVILINFETLRSEYIGLFSETCANPKRMFPKALLVAPSVNGLYATPFWNVHRRACPRSLDLTTVAHVQVVSAFGNISNVDGPDRSSNWARFNP